MLQVGLASFWSRIEVNIYHVIEHAHGGGDGLAQEFLIQSGSSDMPRKIDGTEVAHSGFFLARVEKNFRAKIGTVDDSGMGLGRADIGRILESDPRMTGLKQHGQHLAPELDGFDPFEE